MGRARVGADFRPPPGSIAHRAIFDKDIARRLRRGRARMEGDRRAKEWGLILAERYPLR